jgi:hypothetical protein
MKVKFYSMTYPFINPVLRYAPNTQHIFLTDSPDAYRNPINRIPDGLMPSQKALKTILAKGLTVNAVVRPDTNIPFVSISDGFDTGSATDRSWTRALNKARQALHLKHVAARQGKDLPGLVKMDAHRLKPWSRNA